MKFNSKFYSKKYNGFKLVNIYRENKYADNTGTHYAYTYTLKKGKKKLTVTGYQMARLYNRDKTVKSVVKGKKVCLRHNFNVKANTLYHL